ncbi:helix-turn-helix domain-containing protein [Nitrincola alkalisediminis]|uniref:helix-turn-helix domain-containing protein n=1 Tax=Nitrincola alkalisediminis TaxID=1366656 RepID=UPI001875BDB3|nr:helix-turn-helix domain-containing protein [Nitrincola alkalisediminis]
MHLDRAEELGFELSGFRHRRTSNVEDHARCFSGWKLHYNQVTKGLFEGSITELDLQGMQLIRDCSNQAMVKSGEAWEGAVTFSLPLALNVHNFYCDGHEINVQSVLAASGDHLPDLRTPAGIDLLCVAVERSLLEDILERQQRDFKLDLSVAPGCFHLTNPACREDLVALVDSVFGGQDSQGRKLMAYAAIRAGIRDTVLMHLLDLVDCEAVISLPTTARKLIVDRACEYALANPDAPPSIIDLCNRVGASRRKLQYCFQETLGINPVAYLRMLRLNAVHRELLQPHSYMAVQDIAMHWGFWHLSRFSSEYRQLFGELPSDTLRRARKDFADFG